MMLWSNKTTEVLPTALGLLSRKLPLPSVKIIEDQRQWFNTEVFYYT